MTNKEYEKIRGWFLAKQWRIKLLKAIYTWLPRLVAASYPIFLVLCYLRGIKSLLRGILVPAAVFSAATIFRLIIDMPRPYEASEIQPLIPREKKGHSFPSRHAASAGIIAMAWAFLSLPAGIIFLIAAILIAASRVLAGVHYIRDVSAGLLFSIAAGSIGFFICF